MPYRTQSSNRLTERIHAVVRSALDCADILRVIVACSGGADSTCLAHVIAAITRQADMHLTICHVQHHVRADDDRDADAVRALANDLGVDFRLVRLPVDTIGCIRPPSEGDLREVRYRALAMIADDEGADAVLTGHTLDDQAETVLLHLLRGAGLDGLGGMREDTSRSFPDGLSTDGEPGPGGRRLRIIRPLLSVRHEETVAYCDAHGLSTIHDPTNDDVVFTRNWVRHAILPALRERNPDIVSALARTASLARDDAAFLAAETARAMARCECRTDSACVDLSHGAFAVEHIAIQRRILRRLFERVTGHVPRASDIDAAQRHANSPRSSALREYGGVACALAFGRLVFGAKPDVSGCLRRAAANRFPLCDRPSLLREEETVTLSIADDSVAGYLLRIVARDRVAPTRKQDGAAVSLLRLPPSVAMTVRNRVSGDSFRPVDRVRAAPLNDYLAARGVPAPVRDLLPLLVVNDTIAWMIGHDVGAEFAATEATATHRGILTRSDTSAKERIGAKDG